MSLLALKNPRIARFVGSGNASMNGRRGWQIRCSRCSCASKIIVIKTGGRLPPKIVIKKLTQSGWIIGNTPKNDLCTQCHGTQSKSVKSHVDDLAMRALHDIAAPIVPISDERRIHFSELKAAVATLDAAQAKELIELLRQRIPQKPKRVRRVRPTITLHADPDYESWLIEMENTSK